VAQLIREQRDISKPSLETLQIALTHIEKRGSLLELVPDRAQRLEWTRALADERLVIWNRAAAKYEIAPLGRLRLDGYWPIVPSRLRTKSAA
jgi:hypothetical protein